MVWKNRWKDSGRQYYAKARSSFVTSLPFSKQAISALEGLGLVTIAVTSLLATSAGTLVGYSWGNLTLLAAGVAAFAVGIESGKNRRFQKGNKKPYTGVEIGASAVGLYLLAANLGYITLYASLSSFGTGLIGAGIIVACYIIAAMQD